MIKQFQTLQECNNKNVFTTNTKYVKESVIDLTSENLPEYHKSLLNLGPKFVPNSKRIPFVDIISTTESSALKLEYNQNVETAQTLRKDVLQALKLHRSTKDNLTKQQRIALKEIREDNDIKIYPFE